MDTPHQAVERAGGQAACLNFFWFRGDQKHKVHIPWLLKLWPGVPFSAEVAGPTFLSLGDFVSSRLETTGEKLKGRSGLKHRYGFDDASTVETLLRLVRSGEFPELTTAYFPNNDFDSHERGAEQALETVERFDYALGELFAAAGGLEKLLQEAAIVVTGDHAQSDLPREEEQTGLFLDDVLTDFTLTPVGANWRDEDDLMVCPNMRAAQIYVRPRCWTRRGEIIEALLREQHVDQVIWREPAEEDGARARYHVATRDRGRLEFRLGKPDRCSGRDEYGAIWNWSGDLAAVGAALDPVGVLRFGDYPNAFERLAAAFDRQVSGEIWATSRVGYEFRRPGVTVHPYGSHGSLHALDSLSPLIVAGAKRPAGWRQTPRAVDIAPLCCSILNIPPMRPLGGSHVMPSESKTP